MARTFPQTAHSGLQKSLQNEWTYIQRVVEGTGDFFPPLEEALANGFLPALFGEPVLADDYRRPLAALPVKFAGLALPDPTATATANYQASTLVCSHLIQALKPGSDTTFSQADHSATRADCISEMKDRKLILNEAELTRITEPLDADLKRTLLRGKKCGQ